MSRRKRVFDKKLTPEPIFGSELVAKLINHIMWDGKKSVAEAIVYGALDIASKKMDKGPVELLQMAIDKLEPVVEIRSRRVGGSVYPVPVEVQPVRRRSLAMRWLVNASRNRGSVSMHIKLANELMDILNGQGAAMKKREDVHRMAEANKAFSHFRF